MRLESHRGNVALGLMQRIELRLIRLDIEDSEPVGFLSLIRCCPTMRFAAGHCVEIP